jgi:hypothetical protein
VNLCEGGTLFVRDADLLTPAAQQGLVEAMTTRFEQQARSSVPAPRLVLSSKKPPALLLQDGAHDALRPWLQRSVYELPRLVDRPEDLRSIILDWASRYTSGPEQHPLGVERTALRETMPSCAMWSSARRPSARGRSSACPICEPLALPGSELRRFHHRHRLRSTRIARITARVLSHPARGDVAPEAEEAGRCCLSPTPFGAGGALCATRGEKLRRQERTRTDPLR